MRLAWMLLACAGVSACGRDHFDPPHNLAFVTSIGHDPSTFGRDLSGADGICADTAAAASLGGKYIALLSTSQINGTDRLAGARGWNRVDGEPLADSVDDLIAGLAFRPLRVDEVGEEVSASDAPVAIGHLTNTTDIHMCTDWTTSGGVFDALDSDESLFVNTGAHAGVCTQLARLFCFGTTFDVPLTPSPASGRKAFVTVQGFTAGGGLAAADALCNQEASLAGIPGTFQALLATSTASAASRFDLAGPTWVRVDGVRLAASAFDFMAGSLEASLSLTSAGTAYDNCVITGGPPTVISGLTCNDWTSTGGMTDGGSTASASGRAFEASPGSCVGCDGRAPIYCLER